MTEKPTYTLEEVCELLNLAPEKVQALIQKGTLPAVQRPEGWLVPRLALERYRKSTSGGAVPAMWQSQSRSSGTTNAGGAWNTNLRQGNMGAVYQKMASQLEQGQSPTMDLDLSVVENLQVPQAPPKDDAGNKG